MLDYIYNNILDQFGLFNDTSTLTGLFDVEI